MSRTTKPRYCLQCDDGTALVYGTRDVRDDIDGVPYSVADVCGWHCPACGEIEFAQDDDSALRVNAAIHAAPVADAATRAQLQSSNSSPAIGGFPFPARDRISNALEISPRAARS
ncbi:MAG: hypothetical protein LBF16_04950, partial [Pseudomonadales bacterium]|nr:hypothetical protein [Pseudomonadales bacterium]